MMGCLWGIAGVDILQISTLPFSPADHHASDIGVAAPFQKVYLLTAYNVYSVAIHQQRGQRSLIAIPWTSRVHRCNRTEVLACCKSHGLFNRTMVRRLSSMPPSSGRRSVNVSSRHIKD